MAPDMAQMRAQREASFTDTCRLDLTVDTATVLTWPSGSSVACNFTTPSSSPNKSGGLLQILPEERGYLVALPYGTVINAPDRIRRASDGKVFEVIGTDKHGTFGVQMTVAVIELGI